MRKTLTNAFFSLGIFGVLLSWNSANYHTNQVIKNTDRNKTIRKDSKQENQFYFMDQKEATEPFNPDDAKYNSFWTSSLETLDLDGSTKKATDLFVIKDIEYDGAYKVTFYWAHNSHFLSDFDLFGGVFNFNLYKNGQKKSNEIIPFDSTDLIGKKSLEATFIVDDNFDQFYLSYNFVAFQDRYVSGSSQNDYSFTFEDYFAFTIPYFELLNYKEAESILSFAIEIDFQNGKLFSQEQDQLFLEIDGIKFQASPYVLKKQKDSNYISYQVAVSKDFLFQSRQAILVVNNFARNNITNQFLPEIKKFKPQRVDNILLISSLIMTILILLVLLIIILLLIKKHRNKIIKQNYYYEYKTYVDSNGEYIEFNQQEWERLSKKEQKLYSEVPETELLDGYYKFHSSDE